VPHSWRRQWNDGPYACTCYNKEERQTTVGAKRFLRARTTLSDLSQLLTLPAAVSKFDYIGLIVYHYVGCTSIVLQNAAMRAMRAFSADDA